MSYWIELHCDLLKDGQNPNDILRPLCRTHENNHPMGGAEKSGFVSRSIMLIQEDAYKRGWERYRGKWFCPGCKPFKKEAFK